MNTAEINARNANDYWKLVSQNDAPSASSIAEDDDDKWWWADILSKNVQKPYTIEEIHSMIAESERQFAEGDYMDFDEALDEIEAELSEEDVMKYEMAEAV